MGHRQRQELQGKMPARTCGTTGMDTRESNLVLTLVCFSLPLSLSLSLSLTLFCPLASLGPIHICFFLLFGSRPVLVHFLASCLTHFLSFPLLYTDLSRRQL